MSIIGRFRQLDTNSRLYLYFIGFFWLLGYFGSFWRRIGVDPSLANSFVLLFFAVLSHGKWRHMVRLSDVTLYLSIAFFYFINVFTYPISRELVMSNAFEVLCVVVPSFFIGIVFKEEEYSYWLTQLSRLSVIINLLFSFFVSSAESGVDEESMHRAYVLLPSVLYLLWQLLEHFKLVDLLFFALGFFLECSMGSRGPFVCILFFLFVYLFFFKEWKHKTIMRFFLIAMALSLFALSTYLAEFMILLLASFGKSTRIFDKMLDDSLVNYQDSNGRDRIHEELLRQLKMDDSGFGYGLFSDRFFTEGFSSHNIIIELWFSYGYYIGSILLGILLVLFIRFFLKTKDNHTKVFGLLIFTASFVKLLFSGCFILEGYLFFLIGYCLNGLRASKS